MKNSRSSKWFSNWKSRPVQVAVFLAAAGLSACIQAESVKNPERPPAQLPELAFTFDANGNIAVKDQKGKPVGQQCSLDPNSANVCPMFKPGHKIQLEQVSNISVYKYSGSPTCYTIVLIDPASNTPVGIYICL